MKTSDKIWFGVFTLNILFALYNYFCPDVLSPLTAGISSVCGWGCTMIYYNLTRRYQNKQ